MSLVGSLEDLSLGDILQIISLSQKSGVLALKTTGCDGRIVFVNGLVRGAGIKGGPQDLRSVLVEGGFLQDDEFMAAAEHASHHGSSIAAAVGEITSLSKERVDSLCREAIESAVVTMFSWHTGDFSFDVRNEAEQGDPELLLPTGINAQYLAMEGARVKDEDGQEGGESYAVTDDSGIDEMSAHDFFGVSPDAPSDEDEVSEGEQGPDEDAVQTLALATAQRSDVDETLGEGDLIAPDPIPDEIGSGDEPAVTLLVDEDEALEAAETELVHEPAEVGAEIVDARLLAPDGECEDDAERRGEQPLLEAEPLAVDEVAASVEADASPTQPDDAPVPAVVRLDGEETLRPLVALDDDLPALEWLKGAVHEDFEAVHIFQSTDQALQRVRQYLVRGKPPVILISPNMQVDSLGGIRDTYDFVARLKAQSPRITALWLGDETARGPSRMGAADGLVIRPEIVRVRGKRSPEELEELGREFAQKLRIDLAAISASESVATPDKARDISPDAIRRLRDATRALTEASSRGEVLPLVIRFASEVFSRVAMFMVRDGRAVGMAGHGLDQAGGPDDAGLREISIDPRQSLWMRSVLEHGKPVQGTVDCDGDRMLVALLGDRPPPSVYMAPIESTGQVIALLYGDNLPHDGPLGDTSALEVVLHHAGLALDRAALERALQEDAS